MKLTVTKVEAFQGKIYDGWIFLFNKVVLRKPLVMNYKIWRKLLTIEPTQLTPRFLSVKIIPRVRILHESVNEPVS
jgi:hypothetical protein